MFSQFPVASRVALTQTLDTMFDNLRNRWERKNIAAIVFSSTLIALLLFQFLSSAASPGHVVGGVVLSSGSVSLGRAYGSTNGVALVRLDTGENVSALIAFGGAPTSGAHVKLLERSTFWGGRAYELIALTP